jgi:hypothetical protein
MPNYRVFLIGCGAEADSFVALGEFNGEKSNQCLNIVISDDPQGKWRFECEISNSHCVQVNFLFSQFEKLKSNIFFLHILL